MKRTTHQTAFIPAVAATLLAACLGPFEDPVDDPYREPRGDSAAYQGMLNETQRHHLRSAAFPRLTKDERRLIRRVNADVNRDIRYLSDAQNYALPDRAVTEPHVRRPALARLPPARYGDCEDYALTKKHRLARSGFSASRAFVALAVVPEDGKRVTHSALAVPEGGDWWILNNWDNHIQRASSLERWWDWEFISPRYDTYLLSIQMRRIAQQADAGVPASGGDARARR
jgi:predicted transglutaminase-like cysteine proteinase